MNSIIQINYIGDAFFLAGLNELKKQLPFDFSESGRTMQAIKKDNRKINVTFLENGKIEFTYYDKPSFFRAFSLALEGASENSATNISVMPSFLTMGTMQNCQWAVLTVETVKGLIRQHSLMGYSYIELYTETTYEIPNEPYFGYKKGKYKQEELKELNEYSKLFGIEMVPCIQTLGHLSNLFNWEPYGEVFDIRDTLLVDYPKTYELIENMIKSVAECFDTNKINLGMDEAYFMGFGRYNWFIDSGKKDTSLLFIKHLKKVLEIAEKYGFTKPSIWFDNLFEINYKGYIDPPEWLFKDFSEEIRSNFPKVNLIYWNYVIRDEKEFCRYVGYVKQLSKEVSFASMAHGYTSFAPENHITEKLVETALKGSLQCNITDLLVTWWGSNFSPFALLPSYYNYAEKTSVSSGVDFEKRSKFLFGYTYKEFCALDIPNISTKSDNNISMAEGENLPFYALANDALTGMLDRHIPDGAEKDFTQKGKILRKLSKNQSIFSDIFHFEAVLCDTLAVKAELSKKIKKAYDKKNKDELLKLSNSIAIVLRKIEFLHKTYRKYYLSFAKPFGSAEWDANFGGLIMRLKIAKTVINDYVFGRTEKISELEEERLPINSAKDGAAISYRDFNGALYNK